MTERDPLQAQPATGGRPGPRYVSIPVPHAGIGKALRATFAPGPVLPDDLDRLLGRLR